MLPLGAHRQGQTMSTTKQPKAGADAVREAKPMKWRCLCCGAFITPEKDGRVVCKKCGWSADT